MTPFAGSPLEPLIEPPTKRGASKRPGSPITFASEPKRRPISPIMFASTSTISPVNSQLSFMSSDDEHGAGYEEDDELDSDEAPPIATTKVTRSDSKLIKRPHTPISKPATSNTRLNELSASAVVAAISSGGAKQRHEARFSIRSVYNPDRLSIIRFSTGQVLEDEYSMEWYDIKPYELLEIHRAETVVRLPRHSQLEYIKPHWEGWVKSLRVVFSPSGARRGGAINGNSANSSRATLSKPNEKRRGKSGSSGKSDQRFEWRDRWLVIHHGVLILCRDRRVSVASSASLLKC